MAQTHRAALQFIQVNVKLQVLRWFLNAAEITMFGSSVLLLVFVRD